MARLYKRVCELIVGAGGNGLKISKLRIDFKIEKTSVATPNKADIRVYNLHPDNEAKIRDEYTDVLLNAGYESESRMIFRGNILAVRRYREGTDWITQILAGDGDAAFRKSVTNKSFAAGTTKRQLKNDLMGAFGFGVTAGEDLGGDESLLRGKVISGSTKDALKVIATDDGAQWSIQDGKVQIVPVGKTLTGVAVVLRSDTGLLEAPEITDTGIKVKCLLNATIRVYGTVKLDNNGLKQKLKFAKESKKSEASATQPKLLRLDPDGLYKVFKLKHEGSNRGNDWYTELEAVNI